MNILQLAHARWFNAEAQYAVDLALAMERRGHRTAVLGLRESATAHEARRAGLEVFEESGFNGKGLRALGAVPAARRLLGLLRAGRFDAVEAHRPEGLPLVAWACRRAGVPLVRVRGDMRPVRADPLNRWLYTRGLAGVVASNRAIEAGLRERLGGRLRIRTIHGGVDAERFCPEGIQPALRSDLALPEHVLLVGILGRLGEVKGHRDFLAAARQSLSRGADAGFVVLAKEPSEAGRGLEREVGADPLLRDRVRFIGRQEDLPGTLRVFDLGVIASVGSEANCRVGLEWMASGVPLLATRVGVLPDLVDDGATGYLVPPGDPSSLAEKIVYLDKRRGEVSALGQAARDRVLGHFTLDHCARAHEQFLQEALQDR